MPNHSTPSTGHSRINGNADTNQMFYAGEDCILVVDSDGHFFISAATMSEARYYGESLGNELGVYVQVSVPAGISVVEYAHSLGY